MPIVGTTTFRGIEGVRCGRFPFFINTASWFYRIGDTLLDCGSPNQRRSVVPYAKKHNVRAVYVTHHHEDHSGNAFYLQEALGVSVYSSRQAVLPLSGGYSMRLYRHIFFGRPPQVEVTQFPEQIILSTGEPLVPIPTPGHCPDHFSLLLPERGCLVAGDLYVSRFPVLCRFDQDPNQEIESLRRALSFDFDTVLCGHKGVVTDGKRVLSDRLNFLLELKEKVKRERERNPHYDSHRLQRAVLGRDTDFTCVITQGEFSKRFMVEKLGGLT